ncbi:Roadblock/LC7 domain containing protein [Trichomonas vaginalis G3]|uniref:Roadblock/LC7 domain containing protein n=1 Tax=Trichomonas vaginalis (strain ATCC PRA-98 / G3) TaxID=412133 RepID=A2G470_TRIV3|nr:dynein intermediate chain binding [Trichomonas vaginalis G3]EAX88042.1 Roadblock/LC7 domain containing protein [Trichomonas vaginalis G3]KAI5497938.1 dynein intermediate chain binding [Trichomonas vaginalis G3]|eukprot:XP_001300972.1 Roadblock/LC7 domain containing protein [Trichomonas vaginalis G3]
MSEVDQTLKRIVGNKTVDGILVLDGKNKITHAALKQYDQNKVAEKLSPLIERARCMVRDLDPTNDLTFLRIRADNYEILVSPGDDYTLIVFQKVTPLEQ